LKSLKALILAAVLGLTAWAPARAAQPAFDHYVLALTWVPYYCGNAPSPDAKECGEHLGFALFGLWPENAGSQLENCTTVALPATLRATYADLFPSAGMIDHQWSKHGTCAGLSPAAYFALLKQAYTRLTIPAAYAQAATLGSDASITAAFVKANAWLKPADIFIFRDPASNDVVFMGIALNPSGQPVAFPKP
jgi:ribonuclease T2